MLDLAPWRVRRLVTAGLVNPERGARGEYRFAFVDLVVLRTARDLLLEEVPFRQVRRALANLRDALPADRSITELRIVADHNRVVVREEDTVWDAESSQVLLDFAIYELAEAIAPILASAPPRKPPPEALDANDWFELACKLEMTSSEEACAAYRRAIRADAAHVDAHFNLAGVLERLGQKHQALRHLKAYRKLVRDVGRESDA